MSFEKLPLDMVVKILSNLSGNERARLATTNVAVARAVVRLNKEFEDKFSEEFPMRYAKLLAEKTTVNDWQARYEDSNEEAYEDFGNEERELLMVIKARPFDVERCKEKIEAIASKMAGMEGEEDKLDYLKEFFHAFDEVERQTLVQWVWQHRQSSDIAKDVLNEIYTKIIERYFSGDKNILLGFAILCHQPVDKIEHSLNASNVDQESAFGQTPLTLACQSGDEKVVGVLLEMGADINAEHVVEGDDDDEDVKNVTPLMVACEFGNIKVVKLLVERNADLKGNATFEHACECRQDEAAEILMSATDPERALLISCLHGRSVLVEILLNQMALTEELATRVMLDAAMSNEETIRVLIKKGVDVNATNEDGSSGLMNACQSAQLENIRILVENGAAINVANNDHLTPLGLACLTNSENVSFLLKHGADVNFALMHARISGHVNIISALEAQLQAIKKRAHECRGSIRMISTGVLDEDHIKSLAKKYTALSDASIHARHILPLISAINDRVPYEQFMDLIQHSRRSGALSALFSDFTDKKFYDENVKSELPRESHTMRKSRY